MSCDWYYNIQSCVWRVTSVIKFIRYVVYGTISTYNLNINTKYFNNGKSSYPNAA